MTGHPQESTTQATTESTTESAETFALRLSVFYGALFVTLGVQLPFLPLWLAAKGLDAGMIGLVLALPMVVRVFAIPVAARAADRRDALRAVIRLATVVAVLGYGLLGIVDGGLAITIVFALASAVHTPVFLLIDAYALRGLMRRGRAYGPVRLWGSTAFIVSSFAAGSLLDLIAPRDLIWLIVSALAGTAAAAFLLAPLGPRGANGPSVPPSAATGLWRNPAFLAMAAAASLVQASHALYYGFSTIDWQAQHLDGVTIGALWALGVVAEIVLFALSARLPTDLMPATLIVLGAVGASIRWLGMALSPPPALLPLLQCLHALSFGATHLGALAFVAKNAPPGLATTAQGYLAVAQGLAMAAATGLSGWLYGRYGGLAYGAMALTAVGGGLCALAAKRMTTKR
jgi:MFS transporter, PPP family, 3-phenylpropionic acid transporter